MALWAYIPAKHLQAVGSLPQSARRLDTGQLINDLPGVNMLWTRACGWWDLDTIDVPLLVETNKLTPDELEALTDEVNDALAERTARQQYVENARTVWAATKDIGQDWLEQLPPYTLPGPAPTAPVVQPTDLATVVQWLTYLNQSRVYHQAEITYLYDHERRLTEWQGQVGDVVMVLAQVVAELAEQADGIALPD